MLFCTTGIGVEHAQNLMFLSSHCKFPKFQYLKVLSKSHRAQRPLLKVNVWVLGGGGTCL